MKKTLIQIFLVSAIIIGIDACKPEDKPDPKPAAQQLTLDQTEAMQYSTLVIVADIPVDGFNNKVNIAGIETDAVVMEGKYIAFMIKPDIPAGTTKISVQCNNGHFELPITIKELPVIADPKATLLAYRNEMKKINDLALAAVDSMTKWFGNKNTILFTDLAESRKIIDDSLNLYITKFNNLDAESQMVAAKIIEANRIQMKETYESIKSFNQMMADGILLHKKAPNYSEIMEQIFVNITRSQLHLINKLAVNFMTGAAIGSAIGAIISTSGIGNPLIGWKLGAVVGFGAAAWFNSDAVLIFLHILENNYNHAWIVAENDLKGALTFIPDFYNDEARKVVLTIKRLNLQPTDNSSKYLFVKNYLLATNKFINFVKQKCGSFIKSTPDFKNLVQISKPVEKFDYLTVKVTDNNKVQFVGFSGTPEAPTIRFKSDDANDQPFSYTVTYNDGVFEQTSTHDGVLTTRINMTLRDTTINGDFTDLRFDVIAPPFLSWKFDYPKKWMIINNNTGTGTLKNIQLAVQNNLTGIERDTVVKFTCGTKVIVAKIKQTPESCKTLKLSSSINGKTVTASATGGKAPYTFQFWNAFAGSGGYTSSNTFDLVYDGIYYVMVKDANGCTDTIVNQIEDLTINKVYVNSYSELIINYSSPLGLKPYFLNYHNKRYTLNWLVFSSNNDDDYQLEEQASGYCKPGGGALLVPVIPDPYDGAGGSKEVRKPFGGKPGNYSISFRLRVNLKKGWRCPDEKNPGAPYWTDLYTINYTIQ